MDGRTQRLAGRLHTAIKTKQLQRTSGRQQDPDFNAIAESTLDEDDVSGLSDEVAEDVIGTASKSLSKTSNDSTTSAQASTQVSHEVQVCRRGAIVQRPAAKAAEADEGTSGSRASSGCVRLSS